MTAPDPRQNDFARTPRDALSASILDPLVQSPAQGALTLVDPKKALTAYSDSAIQIRHSKDVHVLTLMGQRYVMKFRRPRDRSHIRAWASSALCGALFGTFPKPKRLLPGGIHHEARRLRTLRKHGVRVPKVHLITDDHLILEHCGETLETLLKSASDKDRSELLWATVDDLIKFHQAGHWHGGAQVRNLTLKKGFIYRIDFEEQVGSALPLPYAQAFDVLLAFNSLVDYLHDDRIRQGVTLLTHYLKHTPSSEVIDTLARLNHWLRFFRHLEPKLPNTLRHKRDLQRTRTFAWMLNGALTSKPQPPRP